MLRVVIGCVESVSKKINKGSNILAETLSCSVAASGFKPETFQVVDRMLYSVEQYAKKKSHHSMRLFKCDRVRIQT